MTLTEKEIQIVTDTWAIVRQNIVEVGVELFRKFFAAYPEYVQYFPFKELTDLDEICKDSRLKLHAGRVMGAISSIVDNLQNPKQFEENLKKIIDDHIERKIGVDRFVNLKQVLVELLCDKLGTDLMNDEALTAWSKVYDFIIHTYQRSLASC